MKKFDINLNLYRSFYYVAKFGGFTVASKKMMVSQPALSANIKNLEDILGVQLIDRKIGKIALTNNGRELFLKLEEIINILNGVIEQQEINIGCIRVIADNYLQDIICTFKKQNPNIKINLNYSNTTDLFQMLKKEELDIVICRYPLFYKFESYISVEKIMDIENVFACSPNYIDRMNDCIANGKPLQLILPDSSQKRRNVEQYLFDSNINYEVTVALPSSNLLKQLMINEIGIGFINKDSIKDELESNELQIADYFKNIPKDSFTIVYNNKKKNLILDKFIEVLKDTINKSDC